MAKKIDVAGELNSVANEGKLVDITQVKDAANNNKSQAEINSETAAALDNRYTKSETYNKTELETMITTPDVEYVTVTATSQTTAVTDVLPASGQTTDTIYRVGMWDGTQYDTTVYSEYAWNGSDYILLCVKEYGIDSAPTAESDNLVTSGGVAEELALGAVYDVSAKNPTAGPNNDGKFESLSALLSDVNLNTLIPTSVRKGGMSIKFIQGTSQTSDNNYMQYMCKSSTFSTTPTDWEKINNVSVSQNTLNIGGEDKGELAGQLIENPEWVWVVTDKDKNILLAVSKNGGVFFGSGCPPQVSQLLAQKVDKEEGKSLVDSEIANRLSFIENPEYLFALTDALKNIVLSLDTKQLNINVPFSSESVKTENLSISNVSELKVISNPEWLLVIVDSEKNIIEGVKRSGEKYISELVVDKVTVKSEEKSNNDDDKNLKLIADIQNMPQAHVMDENGKEMYSSLPIYNVERRARQLMDVEWTALSPIPTIHDGEYYEGAQQGMPYTSCWEVDRFVGITVSLETFMTLVHNPYSLIYTENLKDCISGYGFTYHNLGGRTTIAGWCGVVCSVFVAHSLGFPVPLVTHDYLYLLKQGRMVKVFDNTAQGVRIGDIEWRDGHDQLVQNVWRDSNGLVTKVEVSQNALHESFIANTEQYNQHIVDGRFQLMRYPDLYKNIHYEPSPFVALDGETPQSYLYNEDICTFAGDKACFREGYKIFLNYNLYQTGSWTSVELYKNDELYGTYTLDSDTSVHRFDLTGLNLKYGKYKARLTDGVNYSDYTFFEVVETNVTYEGSDIHKTRITFDSANGSPQYLRFCHIDGGNFAFYIFTDEEKERGYCELDIVELFKEQERALGSGGHPIYVKVYFEGEYGVVTSDYILTNIN